MITRKVELDSAYTQSVLGINDENLRVLDNQIDADFHARGHRVTVTGPDFEVARAVKVLEELESIARRGHVISPEAVKHAVSIVTVEAPQSVSEVLASDIVSRRGRTIRPKTLGQKEYVDAIDEHTIVFGVGPAGSGKTYLAVAKAVQALQAKQVSRIILTRPAVEAGEKLGFLPGTLNDKIDPYLRPLYDALRDMLDPEMIPKLMDAGVIEVAPLAYMRGRTLNDAFVILDEAQNTTPAQMKMFLTRLGFGSKMIVTGDITQVDLPTGQKSGLRLVREILRGVEGIWFAELSSQDVVRHSLVGRIVDAYDAFEEK
ncbi:PhoH family protein [Corynebacterium sp.]|uniref:PhoH family protein n=1 Tax=Corynebacterium sp. TaxID=1720 RepID=UPI0026E05B5F|nr:PhoH family protein [Corynebacterium sp.]MDO5512400.1 PhoH family protein [Corynebacterium sp.]